MIDYYNHYFVPFLSASLATIPIWHPLEKKTALQLGTPLPKFCFTRALFEGLKAAPKNGGGIGVQLCCQELLEKKLNPTPTPTDIAISSVVVGGVSTPFWVVLNGQTMGWSAVKSLKMLDIKQTNAIIVREAIFLFSLRISTPINEHLKERLGESKALSYATAFTTAVLGSFLSHPADTFFTLYQARERVAVRKLMNGSGITALAFGVFAVLYQELSAKLKILE